MKYVFLTAMLMVSLNAVAKENIVMVANDDAQMNAAIQKAQSTLSDFLKVKENPPEGSSNFRLKVNFEGEHMWVSPFDYKDNDFVGILNNEPEHVDGIHLGDTVEFERGDISDWGYELHRKQIGSYTVCILAKHMNKKQLQNFNSKYGYGCGK